ncbi:hypothetical protein CVT25_009008 [Psilocybe cyanescens]|uniref:Major facilitator superfamily (MFS) profile domain-containing protein n=1 Tax=Psilocybe cyanescens TaxID=93625 RepID=A0A409VRH3_PSICY|nr:hypothetical protein CVT25_009008 [Psilocybe cyanescens]
MTGFSSLHLASEEGQDDPQQKFKGVSKILGPRWTHLPTLTFGLMGVQIFWSVEMSYALPYILSLGLSKSSVAGAFVADPLLGLIMQPLIGVLADNCTSRFGRRRPYMLLGSLICISAMLLLGFTRPFASIFTDRNTDENDILTIWLAVFSVYLIDFSVNAVQTIDRALLVDTLPPSEQAAGNAWAARMLGVGSVVGFFVGNIDLPRLLPFLGKSQLQVLSVLVSLFFLGAHVFMAILVKEKVLLKSFSADGKSNRKSFTNEMKDIWANIRTLPYVIRQICIIQFFTIYVGDLHKRVSPVATNDDERAALDAEATRLGSRALFYSALLALFVNLTVPLFVSEATPGGRPGLASSKYGSTWWERICRVPRSMQIHLATIWAVSHFVFASSCSFTHSVWGSTFIITVTGFSWAITQWAPFSLLAEAILTEPAAQSVDDAGSIRLADTRTQRRTSGDNEREMFLSGNDSDEDDEETLEERRHVLSNSGAQLSHINLRESGHDDDDNDYEIVRGPGQNQGRSGSGRSTSGTLSGKAGVILGIHNIFIVIPQFLVAGFSTILFALFDPEKPVLPTHRAPVAPAPGAVINGTALLATNVTSALISRGGEIMGDLLSREEVGVEEGSQHSNSVVYLFR